MVLTAKQPRVSSVSVVSLKTKLEWGLLDRGINLCWGGLRLCQTIVIAFISIINGAPRQLLTLAHASVVTPFVVLELMLTELSYIDLDSAHDQRLDCFDR